MKNDSLFKVPDLLPFSAPTFDESEKASLAEVLESGWITTGPRTKQFEDAFARYVGCEFAIAVNSCTAALHLALAAIGVDELDAVITTPFTFAATANVIVHQRAFPVFIDIEGKTFNLDPAKLKAFIERECTFSQTAHALHMKRNGRRVRAIIPVHYGGNPCDMDEICTIADRYGLTVIEDAAHAAGAKYKGRNVGTLGKAACFSFYANKNMTTGEGGMLTTNDPELARQVRLLSLHGITKDSWSRYGNEGSWRYDLVEPGFKYNLPDLASALGLHQLKKLDGFIERRAKLANLYMARFATARRIQTPVVSPGCKSAWHLYPIVIGPDAGSRDQLVEQLRHINIGSSVHFIPLHLMTFYQRAFGYKQGNFPVAEEVFSRIISLPLFPGMKDSDVGRVVEAVTSILSHVEFAIAS